LATAVAEMMTADLRDWVAAIQAPVLLIASAMGASGDALTQTVDQCQARVSQARDVDVIAVTQARHLIMLDDPVLLHAEIDRFLVPRAAARVGR
jgi:pimeloyl-ACP methyl ester carboxylesterase